MKLTYKDFFGVYLISPPAVPRRVTVTWVKEMLHRHISMLRLFHQFQQLVLKHSRRKITELLATATKINSSLEASF